MARSRTIDPETTPEQAEPAQASMQLGDVGDAGFGAEFRELARQRRFVRSDGTADPAPTSAAGTVADPVVRSNWRDEAAPPSRRDHTMSAPVAGAAPPAGARVARTVPAAPSSPTVADLRETRPEAVQPRTGDSLPRAAARTATRTVNPLERLAVPRLSTDQRATLLELARMSDRLVESREQLATSTARVHQLEQELDAARARLSAADDRLMASSVLVRDAQRATHELSERAAWLEGRNEMLQEALELAVNASVVTRWKWRREQRARRA